MLINELQRLVKVFNIKEYAQRSWLPEFEETSLTETERSFIDTYQPQQSLIIYGSLAPGRPNHSKVEMIKGTWRQGTIIGKLVSKGWGAEMGYNGFVPAYNQDRTEIPVHVLLSSELGKYLPMLDEFEGNGYKRILAMFSLESGEIGVGNIYALYE